MGLINYRDIKHADGDDYVLQRDYVWYLAMNGSPWPLEIKQGFIFDITLPQIPFVKLFVNPTDIGWLNAALVHDYMLANGVEKNVAAAEFRRVLRAVGIGSIKSWLAFFAVLWFTNTFKEKSR